MTSNILDSLYSEYNELSKKVEAVVDLIKLYGGVVPTTNNLKSVDNSDYPKNGTWKDKILYALKSFNRLVTISDIASKLRELEPDLPLENLTTTIGQYCYVMSSNNEIIAEKSPGQKNRYTIKPE